MAIYISMKLESEANLHAANTVERNMTIAWSELKHLGTTIRVEDNRLMAGNTVINNNFELPDRIAAMMGGTVTYFLGDIRVSTNVKKPDGSRAVGTQLARNAVYESIFEEKKPFRGKVEILGRNYVTGYDPILDEKGHVIGIVYVGFPIDEFFAHAESTKLSIVLIILVSGLGIAFLSLVLIHHRIGRPVRLLAVLVEKIIENRPDQMIPFLFRRDEIGDIARACEIFKNYEAEKHRMQAELRAAEAAQLALRKKERLQLAQNLEQRLALSSQTLNSTAAQLLQAAQELSNQARDNEQKCLVATKDGEQVVRRVVTIASAVLQLSHT
ncbi:MAG: cache domain-containing protein, partial [Alphaproteobacteria bacterium]|nr:cache domain-containing protein [Alphaproteobacteria bacterium]